MTFKKLISSYKKYLNADGNSDKNEYINSFIDSANDSFDKNPSYEYVTKNNDTSTFYDIWVLDENSYKKDIEEKKVIMKPNQPINRGEYINRSDGKWLVTDHDKQYSFSEKGRIKKCNYLLQWKNPEGSIISRNCVITNEVNQTIAVDETRYMRLGEGKYEVSLPDDEETRKMNRDKRLIWEGLAYRITSTNRTTRPGLQTIMVQEHQLNTTTDLINADGSGIANYYGNSIFSIEITSPNVSLAIGDSTTISWVVKLDGVIVPKPVNITSNDNFIQISNLTDTTATVTALSEGNGTIRVSLVGNDDIYSDVSITITSDEQHDIIETISGSESIINGDDSVYSCFKTDNGIQLSDVYTFEIIGEGASLTIIDGNHCSVTANAENRTITLKATNVNTSSVITKNITLNSIW
jgi:hypothetical protein